MPNSDPGLETRPVANTGHGTGTPSPDKAKKSPETTETMRQPGCLIVSLSLWPWLLHSFQDRCLIVSLSLWPWLPHSFQDRCLIASLSLWPWLPHSSQDRCLIVSLSLWPWLPHSFQDRCLIVSLSLWPWLPHSSQDRCLIVSLSLWPWLPHSSQDRCLIVSLSRWPGSLTAPRTVVSLSHWPGSLTAPKVVVSLSHCLIGLPHSSQDRCLIVSLSLWPWLTAPRTVVSLSLCLPAFCARRRKRKPGFSQSYLVLLRRPTVGPRNISCEGPHVTFVWLDHVIAASIEAPQLSLALLRGQPGSGVPLVIFDPHAPACVVSESESMI